VTGGADIRGAIAIILVGISAIGLGCKGFTAKGLPWSKGSYITGKWAEVVGVVCMIIGTAFVCLALYGLSRDR
jgi:uncharacterized membrane protein